MCFGIDISEWIFCFSDLFFSKTSFAYEMSPILLEPLKIVKCNFGISKKGRGIGRKNVKVQKETPEVLVLEDLI